MSNFWSVFTFLIFISLANTQQINNAVCQLPIDPGNCGVLSILSTPTIRYGYDRSSARCIQFTYSGCGGNTNRFTSYNQCVTSCPPTLSLNTLNDYVNLFGLLLTGQTTSLNNIAG